MLRYSADIQTLITVVSLFGLIVLQWTWTPPTVWISALLVVVTCANSFLIAVASHNAVHSPVFRRQWLNSLFQVVLTLGYGHPVSAFVSGHNLSHHRYLQSPRDAMRTGKLRFKWHLLNVLLLPVVVGGAIFKINIKYFKVMRKRNPPLFRQFMLETSVIVVFVSALLVTDPFKFIYTIFIPYQYAVWAITATNMIQHDGCDENSKWNHSRNFVGPVLNFFCFNNGFHTIHHMHPGLHWSLTREAHWRVVSPHIHPALEQRHFCQWVLRAFFLPGVRETYDGRPVVLGPLLPDEDWVDTVQEFSKDLGAIT